MTPNRFGWFALAGLAALIAMAAPAAAEYYEGKPECPPDMACTMTEGAGAEEPIQYGPEDCIDCSGLPDDGKTSTQGGTLFHLQPVGTLLLAGALTVGVLAIVLPRRK